MNGKVRPELCIRRKVFVVVLSALCNALKTGSEN